MNQASNSLDKIKNLSVNNCKILESLIDTLRNKIRGRRKIMFSDIISFIAKEGLNDKLSNRLILWCNYKIRLGGVFVDE